MKNTTKTSKIELSTHKINFRNVKKQITIPAITITRTCKEKYGTKSSQKLIHKANITQTKNLSHPNKEHFFWKYLWCYQISPFLRRPGGTRIHQHLVFCHIYNCYRSVKHHLINWMYQQFKVQGPFKGQKNETKKEMDFYL